MVFKNRVLSIIFGPKRDEVTGCCKKLHNEEVPNVCSSPVIKSRRMRWMGHIICMREIATLDLRQLHYTDICCCNEKCIQNFYGKA
jgi:hypothetical protein